MTRFLQIGIYWKKHIFDMFVNIFLLCKQGFVIYFLPSLNLNLQLKNT